MGARARGRARRRGAERRVGDHWVATGARPKGAWATVGSHPRAAERRDRRPWVAPARAPSPARRDAAFVPVGRSFKVARQRGVPDRNFAHFAPGTVSAYRRSRCGEACPPPRARRSVFHLPRSTSGTRSPCGERRRRAVARRGSRSDVRHRLLDDACRRGARSQRRGFLSCATHGSTTARAPCPANASVASPRRRAGASRPSYRPTSCVHARSSLDACRP